MSGGPTRLAVSPLAAIEAFDAWFGVIGGGAGRRAVLEVGQRYMHEAGPGLVADRRIAHLPEAVDRIVVGPNRRGAKNIAVGKTLWELCAGTLEAGEDPRACAGRELIEETGYEAATIEPLSISAIS